MNKILETIEKEKQRKIDEAKEREERIAQAKLEQKARDEKLQNACLILEKELEPIKTLGFEFEKRPQTYSYCQSYTITKPDWSGRIDIDITYESYIPGETNMEGYSPDSRTVSHMIVRGMFGEKNRVLKNYVSGGGEIDGYDEIENGRNWNSLFEGIGKIISVH